MTIRPKHYERPAFLCAHCRKGKHALCSSRSCVCKVCLDHLDAMEKRRAEMLEAKEF